MKRYLLFLAFACSVFVLSSCDKDESVNKNESEESELTPAGMLVEWGPGAKNVLFPDGCRVDEYSMTYDGEQVVPDDCDIVLYARKSTTPNPFPVDVECKISNNATADVLDVIMHDAWVDVVGPVGKGYVETFIYFSGGFLALLSVFPGDSDIPATKAEFYHNGDEYIVSAFDVYGFWQNNRELRCKYDSSQPFEDVTEHLEYTDCDITIELEVEGKPLTLNITHISPM